MCWTGSKMGSMACGKEENICSGFGFSHDRPLLTGHRISIHKLRTVHGQRVWLWDLQSGIVGKSRTWFVVCTEMRIGVGWLRTEKTCKQHWPFFFFLSFSLSLQWWTNRLQQSFQGYFISTRKIVNEIFSFQLNATIIYRYRNFIR